MAKGRQTKLLSLNQCGETTWDQDRRLHGTTDLPLSEAGRSTVTEAASGDLWPTGMIHHTADEAAVETARVFAQASRAKTKVVADLAEPDLGLLEGLTEQFFAERYPKRYKQWQDDPVSLSPPEGEDFADARARLFATVARIVRRCRGEQVSVVVHALNRGFLRCWLADRPNSEIRLHVEGGHPVEKYEMDTSMIERMEAEARTVSAEAS
jgi:broad specificity phosphatase PhoE